MENKTYFLYTIQGYTSEKDGTYFDVANISVVLFEMDETKALERAKQCISKPFYRVSSVTEYLNKEKC